MYIEKKCKVGDVLCYRKRDGFDPVGSLIAMFSDIGRRQSNVVHVGAYAGSGRVIHSHMRVDPDFYIEGNKRSGCHMAKINPDDHKLIDVYRVPFPLPDDHQNRLIEWMKSKYSIGYDLDSFSESWYRSVLGRLLGWTSLGLEKPDDSSNPHNRFNCGEYVATAYQKALHINLLPHLHEYNVTPADFVSYRSILRRVC